MWTIPRIAPVQMLTFLHKCFLWLSTVGLTWRRHVTSDLCLVVYMCIPLSMMDCVPGSDVADDPALLLTLDSVTVAALIRSQVNMHSLDQWKRHWFLKSKGWQRWAQSTSGLYASLCPISRPHLFNIFTLFTFSCQHTFMFKHMSEFCLNFAFKLLS